MYDYIYVYNIFDSISFVLIFITIMMTITIMAIVMICNNNNNNNVYINILEDIDIPGIITIQQTQRYEADFLLVILLQEVPKHHRDADGEMYSAGSGTSMAFVRRCPEEFDDHVVINSMVILWSLW